MKNLKKGLAVAMSLAMIATVMPTNVNATEAVPACDVEAGAAVLKFIDDHKADLEYDTFTKVTAVTGTALPTVDQLADMIACGRTYSEDDLAKAKKLLGVLAAVEANNKVYEYEKAVFELFEKVATSGDKFIAKFTTIATQGVTGTEIEIDKAVKTFSKAITAPIVDTQLKATADGAYLNGLNSTTYPLAVALQKKLDNGFAGNVDASLKEAVAENKELLDDLIAEYKEDNTDKLVKQYVNKLLETAVSTKDVNGLVNDDAELSYKLVDDVKKVISNIEGDKVNELSAIAKYADMKDEPEVEEIMDALDGVVETMNEVKEFVADYKKTDEYKDLTAAIKTKLARLSSKADISSLTEAEITASAKVASNILTTKEIGIVKTFVEEIVNEFYTVEKTKRTNDTYRVTYKNEDGARFLGTEKANVLPTEVDKVLLKLLKSTENVTFYDALIDANKNIDTAIKEVTTGIKGVSASNLNASNVNKVIAADKAYGVLTGKTISSYYTGSGNGWDDNLGDGLDSASGTGYINNLTATQKSTISGQIATLKNLVAKMYALGLEDTELKTGWVDLGNGNWDFFNEDGTPATKWVAAGKLWYYVKGGHMLTNSWVAQDATGNVWYYVNGKGEMVVNTTIDGYAINANGEWHK